MKLQIPLAIVIMRIQILQAVICPLPNDLDWPLFIGDGTQGQVEVESFDVDGNGNMVLGIASTDTSISFTANRIVQFYDVALQSARWTKLLENSVTRVNVYFADSDAKVLVVWARPNWTFGYLDSTDGSQIGQLFEQGTSDGDIQYTSLTIASNQSIYFMTIFPTYGDTGLNTMTGIQFDGSIWSKIAEQTFPETQLSGTLGQTKSSVFMGLDENYVFSLSSSDGGSGKNEDCGLALWQASTLDVPTVSKKNHTGLHRNCVFPVIISQPSELYVLMVVEYMSVSSDTYTGFMRYTLESDYSAFSGNKDITIKYIDNQRLQITGVYCPSHSEWYAMATDTDNLIVYYDWSNNKANIWTLTSHASLHTFSYITGTASGLPITGFYGGAASTVATNAGCQFSFTDIVGQVSQIEINADSKLVEVTTFAESSILQSDSGNGIGASCTEGMNDPQANVLTYVNVNDQLCGINDCSCNTIAITEGSLPGFQSLTQSVHDAAQIFTWSDAAATNVMPGIDCGLLNWTLTMQDGSPIDTDIFTVGATSLEIYSEDISAVNVYTFQVHVEYTDYSSINDIATFQVTFQDVCSVGANVATTSVPFADKEYNLHSGVETLTQIAEFVAIPAFCPLVYQIEVDPILNALTFDPVSRIISIESTDDNDIGEYTVLITSSTELGQITSHAVPLEFKLSVSDPPPPLESVSDPPPPLESVSDPSPPLESGPCMEVTFKADQQVVKNRIQYSIRSDNDPEEFFLNSALGLFLPECQYLESEVENLGAVNGAARYLQSSGRDLPFEYNQDQMKLTIEISDISLSNTYEFQLSIVLDLTVTLTDATPIGGQTWLDLKESAMETDIEQQNWFTVLTDAEKEVLNQLIVAQITQSDMNQLSEQTARILLESEIVFEVQLIDESCNPPEMFRLTDSLKNQEYVVGESSLVYLMPSYEVFPPWCLIDITITPDRELPQGTSISYPENPDQSNGYLFQFDEIADSELASLFSADVHEIEIKFTVTARINSHEVTQSFPLKVLDQTENVFGRLPDEYGTFSVRNYTLDAQGLLTINFESNLKIPTIYEDLEVSQTDVNFDDRITEWLELDVGSFNYERGSIEISIRDYSLKRIYNATIEVQIEFEQPEILSIIIKYPENINFKFTQQPQSEDGDLLENEDVFITLIPQLIDEDYLSEMEMLQELVSDPVITFCLWTFAINLIAGISLKYMWKVINVLQFVVFYTIWQIYIPPKSFSLILEFRKLVFFEFAKEWIMAYLFTHEGNEEVNSEEHGLRRLSLTDPEEHRLGTDDFLRNAGAMALFLIVIVLVLILMILLFFIGRRHTRVYNFYLKLKKKVFWNLPLRYVMQSALKLQIASSSVIVLTLRFFQVETIGEKHEDEIALSSEAKEKLVTNAVILVILSAMPIVLVLVLSKNRGTLSTQKTKEKIGSMYQTIQPTTKKSLTYPIVFLLRRSLFVAVTFGLFNYPIAQIMVQVLTSVAYIIFITHLPVYDEALAWKLEALSELMFLLINYNIIITNQQWIIQNKDSVFSTTLITLLIGLVLFNLIIITVNSVRDILHKLRLRKLKATRNRFIEEHVEAINNLRISYQFNNALNPSSAQGKRRRQQILAMRDEAVRKTNIKITNLLETPDVSDFDYAQVLQTDKLHELFDETEVEEESQIDILLQPVQDQSSTTLLDNPSHNIQASTFDQQTFDLRDVDVKRPQGIEFEPRLLPNESNAFVHVKTKSNLFSSINKLQSEVNSANTPHALSRNFKQNNSKSDEKLDNSDGVPHSLNDQAFISDLETYLDSAQLQRTEVHSKMINPTQLPGNNALQRNRVSEELLRNNSISTRDVAWQTPLKNAEGGPNLTTVLENLPQQESRKQSLYKSTNSYNNVADLYLNSVHEASEKNSAVNNNEKTVFGPDFLLSEHDDMQVEDEQNDSGLPLTQRQQSNNVNVIRPPDSVLLAELVALQFQKPQKKKQIENGNNFNINK